VNERQRVLVTGIGVAAPLALGAGPAWEALVAGRSAIGHIHPYEEAPPPGVWIGAQTELPALGVLGSDKLARRLDRFARFALAAAELAWRDAALTHCDASRWGTVMGTGFGGIESLVRAERRRAGGGCGGVSPFLFPALMANSAAAAVSIRLGLRGASVAVVDDGLSGAAAVVHAMRMVQRGEADVMFAGASEAPLVPLVLAGLRPFGLAPHGHRDVSRVVRPFSRRREGFALGEGAAVLVLESEKHAEHRGARVYAELAGAGAGMGGGSVTGAVGAAMTKALDDAGLSFEEIDHINADGLATQAGDAAESQAISRTFGPHAPRLTVSATKAATGHLWGAAGALEAAIAALTLRHQMLPPTLNWEPGDTTSHLDYVPRRARAARVQAALSNSRGLGQRAVTLALKRYS
jgi:3-oxoacyl-[acyl-carrier-protein] synthase II